MKISKIFKKFLHHQIPSERVILRTDEIPKNLNTKDLRDYLPPITEGRVIKVYDGDSITVASRIHHSEYQIIENADLFKFQLRINRIDTPEIRTKNEIEKELAIKIRDILSNRILGKMIKFNIYKADKYGRLLVEIFHEDVNINEWLLNNKLAVKYEGGKDLGAFLPYKQVGAVINYELNPNTSLAIEYLHGEYDDKSKRDLITSQVAIEY